jgi:hypothetical protein
LQHAALKLRQAGQNIVFSLNREIDSRAPSAAAIYAAARSLAPLTPAATPAPPGPASRGFAATCPSKDDIDLFKAQKTYYQKRQRALDDALDELDKLNSACELNAPPIADLAVSRDSITLAAETSYPIRITGGRPPYDCTWDTKPPSTSIALLHSTPDVCEVVGLSTIKNGEFKLTIRDSGASARSKVVTVTAKGSS